MFELNPSMDRLYPAESRYACEAFYIEDGSGEYFDLGQKPIVRVPFAIGRASLDMKGAFEISEGCEGCGACASACPQGCIARAEGGTFRIDQGACLRCGLYEEACPHGAVRRIGGMKRMEDLAYCVSYLVAERFGAKRARETAASLEGDERLSSKPTAPSSTCVSRHRRPTDPPPRRTECSRPALPRRE